MGTGPVLVAVDDAEAVQPGASRTVDDDARRCTCGLSRSGYLARRPCVPAALVAAGEGRRALPRPFLATARPYSLTSELLGDGVTVSGPPLFEPAFEDGRELALLLAGCDARRGG